MELEEVYNWPIATEILAPWHGGHRGDTGLVMLNVSFVARDPKAKFLISAVVDQWD